VRFRSSFDQSRRIHICCKVSWMHPGRQIFVRATSFQIRVFSYAWSARTKRDV
jgi:hypothetical protein